MKKLLGDRIDPEYYGYKSSWYCDYDELENVEAVLEECGWQQKPDRRGRKVRSSFSKEISTSSLSILDDLIERTHKPRESKVAKWSAYSREQVARYYALRCVSLGKILNEEEIDQDSFLPDWNFFKWRMRSAFLEDLQEYAYDCNVMGYAELYQPVLDARETEREKAEAEKIERKRVNTVLMRIFDERQTCIDEIVETALLAYQAEEQKKWREEKAKKAAAKAARKKQFELQQEAEEQQRQKRAQAREAEMQYSLDFAEEEDVAVTERRAERQTQQKQPTISIAQHSTERPLRQEKRPAFEATHYAQKTTEQPQSQPKPHQRRRKTFGSWFGSVMDSFSALIDTILDI